MRRSELSPEALVRYDLLARHLFAAREGDEAKRVRLSALIDEIDWVYPDCANELDVAYRRGVKEQEGSAGPSNGPWVLLLNDMRSAKFERQMAVCKAERREDLEALLERERVKGYRTHDRWGKGYRQGGPLEWFNQPWPEAGGGIRHADELEGWMVKETPWLHELEAQFAPAGGGA